MPAFHGFITTNTTMRTMVIILHESSIDQLICSSKIMGWGETVCQRAHIITRQHIHFLVFFCSVLASPMYFVP